VSSHINIVLRGTFFSSTLMMEIEMMPEILAFISTLTRLIAREFFSSGSRLFVYAVTEITRRI
jgi:hypothetical protein